MEIIEQYRDRIKMGEQNLQTAIAALDGVQHLLTRLTVMVNDLNDIANHVGNLDEAGLEVLGGQDLERGISMAAHEFQQALERSLQWFPAIESAGALVESMED